MPSPRAKPAAYPPRAAPAADPKVAERERMVLRGSNRMQIVAELRNNLQGDKHKRSNAIVPGREIGIC